MATKKLNSGIEVDAQVYYDLLEWKDKNLSKFQHFCFENKMMTYSINSVKDMPTYVKLLKLAKIA